MLSVRVSVYDWPGTSSALGLKLAVVVTVELDGVTMPATDVAVPAMTIRNVVVETNFTGSEKVTVKGPAIETPFGGPAVTVGRVPSFEKERTPEVASTALSALSALTRQK